MVPFVVQLFQLLQSLYTLSNLQSDILTAVVTTIVVMAEAFDKVFRAGSSHLLSATFPGTCLVAALVLIVTGHYVILPACSLVQRIWLAVVPTSLSQATTPSPALVVPLGLILALVADVVVVNSGYTLPDLFSALAAKIRPPHLACSAERERRYLDVITERDSTIKERDAAIKERDEVIKERNTTIEKREATLEKRDATLARRTERLEQVGQVLVAHEAAIADKDRTIAAKTAAIDEKDAIIAGLNKDIELFRSDNVKIRSLLDKSVEEARAGVERRKATAVKGFNVRFANVEPEADSPAPCTRPEADSPAPRTKGADSEETQRVINQQAEIIAHKDGVIATLQVDVGNLQGEVELNVGRVVQSAALLAEQASTIIDLQGERDSATRLAKTQSKTIEELKAKVEAYEQEAADRAFAAKHLPPVAATSEDAAKVEHLTVELATVKQELRTTKEKLTATKKDFRKVFDLKRQFEECAEAGGARVLQLHQELNERDVERELLRAQVKTLTEQLDKALARTPVSQKILSQLRLPSTRREDTFTAATPPLPSSTSPPIPSKTGSVRIPRHRSSSGNVRQPLADVTSSAANVDAARKPETRTSGLRRLSSFSSRK